MPTIVSSELALRRTLERLLSQARGQPVTVSAVQREPSPFATVSPAEVLSVTLGHGEVVKLFVKHLGGEQPGHPEKQRRDREIRVYAELLDAPGLPVAKLYGGEWNEASGRHELLLEYVDDWSLAYQELRHWFEAARRLARLHVHFAAQADRLARCDYLLRFDATYFLEWAERAFVAAGEESAELAAGLGPVVRRHEPVASLLASQPVTLVHNDLAPKNVLVDRSAEPSRVCIVDWEMAGVGCGLLDLVQLKYGLDEESDRTMCAAYRDEIATSGVLPARPRERRRLFAACELHRTLYRLAFGRSWGVPGERLTAWVGDARRHRASI